MSHASLGAPTTASAHGRRGTVALAWATVLLLSGLLEVLLVEVLGVDYPPMPLIWLAIAASLLVLTRIWDVARPLRDLVVVLLAVIAVAYVVLPVAFRWIGSAGSGSGLMQVLWTRVLAVVVAVVVAAFLVMALRRRPRDLFLGVGDLRAPSRVRLPGTRKPLSWAVLGTTSTVLLVAGFAASTWLDSASTGSGWQRLLTWAPLVVAAAALNAVYEEVVFRAGPLAALYRVVGPGQAILMTSAWFGFAHYYGSIPSGPMGVVQSGLLALLLGTAMVDTRGLGWPVIIHFGIDVIVFAFIVAGHPV